MIFIKAVFLSSRNKSINEPLINQRRLRDRLIARNRLAQNTTRVCLLSDMYRGTKGTGPSEGEKAEGDMGEGGKGGATRRAGRRSGLC